MTSLIWPCLRLWKQTGTYLLLSDAHTCLHSVHMGTAVRKPPESSYSLLLLPRGWVQWESTLQRLYTNMHEQRIYNKDKHLINTLLQSWHPHLVLTSLAHLPDFSRKVICKIQIKYQNSILPRKQSIKRPHSFIFILEQALEIGWNPDLNISGMKSPTCTELSQFLCVYVSS